MNGISISYLFNTWRLNAIQCTFTWTPFHLCLYWNEIFCWSNTFRIDSIWLVYTYHHISWFQWKCHVGNMLLSYSNFFPVTIKFFQSFFPWKIPSSVNLVSIYVRTKLQMKHSKFHKVFCGFRFWATVFLFHVRQFYSWTKAATVACTLFAVPSLSIHILCAHKLYGSKPYIESTYSPFYLFTYFVNILNERFAFIRPYFVVQLKIFCIILHIILCGRKEKQRQRQRQNAKKNHQRS